MKDIGIYIHIPFCIKKCLYCDFCSIIAEEDFINQYIIALNNEISNWGDVLKSYKVKSIFLGGGTPSILSLKNMDVLLETLYKRIGFSSTLEFTIESNPGTLNDEKIRYYLQRGINRLSVGLQAWQDHLLRALGRIHSLDQFLGNYTVARELGFNNINIDLMFGLPGQDERDWMETLEKVVQLKPDHISAYSLKIEDDTPFGKIYDEGKLLLPEEEKDRNMYHMTIEYSKTRGFNHYEISNFATEGKRCIHNIIYWKNEEYLGFGVGAHSYLNNIRFSNMKDITKYISQVNNNKSPKDFEHFNSLKDEIEETMFLGLRMMDGIIINDFEKRFKTSPLEIYHSSLNKLKQGGLLEINNHSIKLTEKGIDLSNQVFTEFLLE